MRQFSDRHLCYFLCNIYYSRTMDIALMTVLIITELFVESSGWRPFTVKVKNASYENFRPEEIAFNVTTTSETFDINMNLQKDISQLFIDFLLAQDTGSENFDMVYANRTIDVCSFLRNRKMNVLLGMTLKILSDFGDIPKGCPIRKKLYSFLNATIDPEKIPPFIPDYTARLSIAAWNKINGKKIIFFKGSGYMTVERSFKSKGERG